jgi:hypothetical protein|tara:strand:- start:155 stop:457 length:303 start_codon:yes stop_codon:yes gene_type:complete
MKLVVEKSQYEAIYRILITSNADNLAEQRNLNEVLELMEAAGKPIGDENPGLPRMFSIKDKVELEVSAMNAQTLKQHIDKGINRFQAWSVRSLADLMDQL